MDSLLKLLPDARRAGVYHSQIDASEIVAAAKTLGTQAFKLDLAKVRSKGGLLDEFAKTLKFPEHFGRNWDALNDCLSDLSWLDGKGWVLILLHANSFAETNEEAFHTVLDVLEGVVEYWREQKKPFWVFVQGKPGWEPDLPRLVSN
jgi:RNAse (barnase) inhibitor barstar